MYNYELHWIKEGKIETLKGDSLKEACEAVGYDASKIKMSECYVLTNQPKGFGR